MKMDEREGGDISYMDMVDADALHSPIKDFYEKSVIFLTGATGFMGKVLIEKLLRTCPKLPKLYILARPKKGKDIKERFTEQFADAIYERLRREQPDFMSKLHILSGDVGSLNLGLSDEDYQLLTKEVTVIFHGAATVRFDEKLSQAVYVNVRGTREVMLLAKKCVKLTALVHISTAYSNCVVKYIDEKFYDPPITGKNLIQMVDSLDEDTCNKITPVILGKFPNTYAFTKMVAENIVKELSDGLPVAIIRPSIIVSTSKEPCYGWIDNVYGPTGVIVGAGLGLLRTLHCNKNIVADIVPVDYVINATIAIGYEVGHVHDFPNKESLPKIENGWEDFGVKEEAKEVPIYNYISSAEKPVTWGTFMALSEKHGFDIPTKMCIWHYCFTLNKYRTINLLYTFFLHIIPAYIVDGIAYCIGRKPMLVKAYQKIHKFSDVISYFSTQQWTFTNKNVKSLSKILTPGDKQIFYFNIDDLNWDEFFYTYVRGIRLYLIKDSFDTIDEGKRRTNILRLAHYALLAFIYFCLFRIGWFLARTFNLFP